MTSENGGCWPTATQRLLLQAALLPGGRSLAAWQEWKQRVTPDSLDSGSRRLLPQLYQNLINQGVEPESLAQYKDVYLNTFLENELLLHTLSEVIRAFSSAGIPTMVLKGSALIPLYYRDSGLRPMADCDLLVPTKQVRRAMSVLKELGWKATYDPPEERVPVSHSTPFDNGCGSQLDLHWHVLWESWHADFDDGFWKRALPLAINGVPTLSLSPTDQLLHICWHGARWDFVPPIRWIADAIMILNNAASDIEWDRLVSESKRRHLSLPIKDCLNYLRDLLDAPVPSETLRALDEIRPFFNERLSYRIATQPSIEPTTVEILRSLSYDLVWVLSSTKLRSWPSVSVSFLQDKWNLRRRWHVPFVLPLRSIKRVGKAWSDDAPPTTFKAPP